MKQVYLKKYLFLLLFSFITVVGKAADIKVYIIISEECPICQFMGPELASINNYYGDKADLYLVFPFKNSNIKKASLFKKEFGLSAFTILLDEDQSIARELDAKVTPEAIVVNSQDEVVYRGRINDTYISPGRRKHAAGRRDLQIAIGKALKEMPIKSPWPVAVGCFITYKNSVK